MIYQCSGCSMIHNVSKPIASNRCGRCGGWLAQIDRTPDPISYLEGLGSREEVKQTGRVVSIPPSVQIYRKPDITTKASEKKGISGEIPLHLRRTQSPAIPSFIPANRRDQVLKETVQSTSQRGEEATPKTESPNRQDQSSISADIKLAIEEMERTVAKFVGGQVLYRMPEPEDPWAVKWRGVLSLYPRILIIGFQGTGKSCFAYYLLEVLHGRCRCYVYRLPDEGISLLPSWLGVIQNLEEAPPGSIVLIDESYLALFSRDSSSRQNKNMAKIFNLARQRKLGFIFVAHESRHIDKNIISCIDTLVIKKPAPLQVGLDRSLLKPFISKAQNVFREKNEATSWKTSYVAFSPSGFEGVLENPKASFWSEKLSHIFASGNMGKETKPAQELSKKEKKERAKILHDEYGYSYGEIGLELGVGKTTAHRWINEKPESGTTTKMTIKL